MSRTLKIYLISAALIAAAAIVSAMISHLRSARLERRAADAARVAATEARRADRLEADAGIYKEKTVHLERQLADLRRETKEKDEELKVLSADTDNARRALRRIRERTVGEQ